jgi:hypothetical protein
MSVGGETQWLWPTPIGLHRFPDAERVNPLLVQAFAEGRAVTERQRGVQASPFFASDDDLLHRVKLSEWQEFVSFIVARIGQTAQDANQEAWAMQTFDIRVGIEGMWFQCSRAGAFHDIHTHGNCSWSGVYIVQIDDHAKRVSHPVYGDANGITRLYGRLFERQRQPARRRRRPAARIQPPLISASCGSGESARWSSCRGSVRARTQTRARG